MRACHLLGVGLWGLLATWGWAQPVPQPTAVPKEAQVQRVRKRILVALGEQLRVAQAPKGLALPAEAQSEFCGWEKKADAWWLTGKAMGVHEFRWGKEDWEVLVQERALKLPEELNLVTFGDYARAEALLRRVRDYLHPQAQVRVEGLQVVAQGPQLIPFQGAVKVKEEKVVLEARKAEQTILSNWPEKIEQDQILLEEALLGPRQYRVMVHHRNMPEQPPRWLEVDVVAGNQGLQLATSPHMAGPSADEIFAGHLATTRFLEAVTGANPGGYIVGLAAGQVHRVEQILLKPSQTVSGMLWLRAMAGSGSLRVQTRTLDNFEPLALKPLEPTARTARGTFPGEILREVVYRVGSPYLYEDLGGEPYVQGVQGEGKSPGNFGVVYRYQLVFDNPGPDQQECWLQISARGGPARACLWLDGEMVITDLLKADPRLLKRWSVAPQSRHTVYLETFPQAGSNYPLSLVLSSRPGAGLAPALPSSDAWCIP